MAKAHGARCERHFTGRNTHVVSGHPSSKTVVRARAEAKHAVVVGWLEESAMRWARQQEALYALDEQHAQAHQRGEPPPQPNAGLVRAAAAAAAAAQPDEAMRRALSASSAISLRYRPSHPDPSPCPAPRPDPALSPALALTSALTPAPAFAPSPHAAPKPSPGAISAIPASLSPTERLKAAIRFIVPVRSRPRVDALFGTFESSAAGGHGAALNAVMSEITELVGEEILKRVMQALGLT